MRRNQNQRIKKRTRKRRKCSGRMAENGTLRRCWYILVGLLFTIWKKGMVKLIKD